MVYLRNIKNETQIKGHGIKINLLILFIVHTESEFILHTLFFKFKSEQILNQPDCFMSFLKNLSLDLDNFEKYRKEAECEIVDKINDEISYESFVCNYLIPNRPCVFGPWLTKGSL